MVRSSSNVSWMVLFSTFLRFTAFLLLLGCLVKCELQFVGHGRHELDGEKIVKLKGNTKIAEKPEDLKPYKESEGSCDVDMDNEGNIKIWYQKNSNTTEKGCSLDMITKKEGPMSMKFGIWHNSNLTECLGDTEIKNHTAATENILPFSFSLKNEEFNTIKKGPSFGTSDDCKNVITCNFTSSECLKVADYSVAWARTEEYVSNFVFLIGDGVPDPCPDVQTSFELMLKETHFGIKDCNSNPDLACSKKENIRKAEEWEIVDKAYSNPDFKFLFTFHILPQTAMRKSIQKFWADCDESSTDGICADDAKFQRCDKMFIEFDKEHFKILVPVGKGDNSTTTEASGMKNSTIILLVVGVTLLILLIIGLAFVFLQNDEIKAEVAKDKTKELSTNIGGTSGNSKSKRSSPNFGSSRSKYGRGSVGDKEKKKTLGSASQRTGTSSVSRR